MNWNAKPAWNTKPEKKVETKQKKYDPLIYGKDQTEGIVSIEVKDGTTFLYIQDQDGRVNVQVKSTEYWVIGSDTPYGKYVSLKGNQPYKYMKTFTDEQRYFEAVNSCYRTQTDHYKIYDQREAVMVKDGYTYFKGMTVDQVGILGFDIEATTLNPEDPKAKVLMISNTFRNPKGEIVRKTFRVDHYDHDSEMIHDWAKWVNKVDPTILAGHNIYMYDLPYLNTRYRTGYDFNIPLGRTNQAAIKFNKNPSKFRKDGSQSYDYHKCLIHGREIIDTMFLAIKYDVGRNYPNYKLKDIIEHEGLTKEGRQFYDAANIGKDWDDPEKRELIVKYGEEDSDDAITLYDLMIPAFFYLTQHIPKPFQLINESASGSQLNSFMVRSYLQIGHSLPHASDRVPYEGAITFGNPGIYRNVRKLDVASLYPSIMLQYKIYNQSKDPYGHFLQMVDYFTDIRLKNKKLAKETGDKLYNDLQQAQKIIINSAYGFLGASGLLYNSPEHAAEVTRRGREILSKGIAWAKEHDYIVPNVDTDSFSYCHPDGTLIPDDQFKRETDEVNSLFPSKIRWEDDGHYKTFIILKAKNYILFDGEKIKLKGSSITDSKKEPKMLEFIKEIVDCLVYQTDYEARLQTIYNKYVGDVFNIQDIKPWCSKKTVTKAVLSPTRTNEAKVLEAIGDYPVQEGDKIWVYFRGNPEDLYAKQTPLALSEGWQKGDENRIKLIERLFKTANIFKNVINVDIFPKYHLKTRKKKLEELVDLDL